jgi:hypothetical protein
MTRYSSLAAHLLHKEMNIVVYLEDFWKFIQPFYSGTYQPAKPDTIEEPAHHLLYQYQCAPHFRSCELTVFNIPSSHAIAT